jgi:MFS family permease
VDSLGLDLASYVNLYQVCFFIPIVFSFPAAQLLDRYGLKLGIYVTLAIALIRNGARMLLFSPQLAYWNQLRYLYWTIQRFLTSLNYAIYMCFPLKLAESWFSESERSFALNLLMLGPMLGSSAGSLIIPQLVKDLGSCHWIVLLNLVCFLVSLVAVVVGVRRSEPAEGPPSARSQVSASHRLAVLAGGDAASKQQQKTTGTKDNKIDWQIGAKLNGLRKEVVRVVRKKNLMIQMFATVTFDQLLLTIVMVLQDIFRGAGLSSVFTGQFMTFLMVAAAVFRLIIATRLRPKIRRTSLAEGLTDEQANAASEDPYNTRTCKQLMLVQLLMFSLFAMSLIAHELDFVVALLEPGWMERYQWLLTLATSLFFVLVHSCAGPYLNEQNAELISGSVSEANSSAWQTAMASLLFNTYAFVFVHLRQLDEPAAGDEGGADHEQPPAAPRPRYLRPVLFACSVAMFTTMLYVFAFDVSARRRRERMRQLKRLSSTATPHGLELGAAGGERKSPRGSTVVEIEMTRL